MKKKIILIRHGRLDDNVCGSYVGCTDVNLSDIGIKQSKLLKKNIEKYFPIQKKYCSPMKRCRQTASFLGNEFKEENLLFDNSLREISFGRWELKRFDEIKGEVDLVKEWNDDPDNFKFPDGESLKKFRKRLAEFCKKLINSDNNTTLVVAHSGVIQTIICKLLNISFRHQYSFKIDYSSVSIVELYDGIGVLHKINDMSHLE